MGNKQTCPRRMKELGPWKYREGLDAWNRDGTCTFCGSLSPEKFFELVEQGAEVGPTDKSYRAYVRDPMVRVHGQAKVYFQHFGEADQHRFIELYNARKMNVGEPGYFYKLPFFVQTRKPKDAADD